MMKQTVLIVDDQESQRLLASESLKHAGFEVLEASDGEEALACFDVSTPAAVLLDVMMPGINGFEVCRTIRSKLRGRYLPVMMMTARDDNEAITQAYEAGATDFIPKPVNPIILAHRMRYMLRSTATSDALRSHQIMLDHTEAMALTGGWEWEPASASLSWTRGFCQLFDLPDAEPTLDDLLALFPADQMCRIKKLLLAPERIQHPLTILHEIIDAAGATRHFESRLDRRTRELSGDLVVSGTTQEVTARWQSQAEIRQLAYFDELTGLPNRSMLVRTLTEMIEADRRPLTICHLDLDNFKHINEISGRNTGDEVLLKVSAALQGRLQLHEQPCVVARLGSDEFVVVSQTDRVDELCRQLMCALDQTHDVRNRSHRLSASIGVTLYPDDGLNVGALLKNAESALCEAKRKGKHCFERFAEDIHETIIAKAAMEHDLRLGLANGELEVFYQPKINAMLQQVVGMEALVRWRTRDGLISPAVFIPLAEESDLIEDIGEIVLQEACRQSAAWLADGLPALQTAVNLSAKQLEDASLAKKIEDILEQTGMPAHLLCLEVTEGMMMGQPELAITVLTQLKALGCSIAVDDFGTGYSSLSYLQKFPIDSLKIDQSFVRNLTSDVGSHTIVSAVVRLAQTMGLKVVAEGVETPEHEQILKSMACDEIQGYLYSKPIPASEYESWLRARVSVSTVLKAAAG